MTSHKQRLQKCLFFIVLGYVLQPACGLAADETGADIKQDEVVVENDSEMKEEGEPVAKSEAVVAGEPAVADDNDVKAQAANEVQAETPLADEGADDGEIITVSGKTYRWVESSRRYVGKAVKAMTGSIDNYLSNDTTFTENESLLRLRLGYVLQEGGHIHPNNDLKLKVDLPKTKNRWSLVFETDPDELEPLEEQKQDNKGTERVDQTTDGSIGAVRFILDNWRKWESDFDVGVKMPLPPNTFFRFNTKRRYQFNENWGAKVKHSVYYFREEGLGEHSTVVFDRPLAPSWTFFNAVDLRWQDQGQILEYANIITFQHVLTERDIFWYRTGAFYQEHPDPHLQSYFVDMIYRRRLHSHWLYGEIIPSVVWSETEDFNSLAALAFRLEVVFD